MRRSRIVVDTYDGALAEAGDILIPLTAGAIKRESLLADLHELTKAKKTVRTGPNDITLFKSVGCALEDLAAAELLEETIVSGVSAASSNDTNAASTARTEA
jgi:ornithine cyclodeaminase/alanine dehydrogenase-like protein (mu-crystallin family)